MTATYVKLQDAHAAETGAAGTWAAIGYIAPGAKQNKSSESYSTTVFDYTNAFTGTVENTTMVGSLSGKQDGWKATAKTALNDCKISSTWTIYFKKAGEGASLAYETEIKAAQGGTDTDCTSLTPNFKNIAHE